VVFQFFTSILWMLDEYWQFVVFQLFMVFVLESTTVFQRIKTFGTLNSMSSKPYKIQAFRNKKWQDMSSLELLPGDLISVKPAVPKPAGVVAKPSGAVAPKPDGAKPKEALEDNTGIVPCDCVLLHGDAVLNEATLTGESVPQMKDALHVAQGQEDIPLSIDGGHRVHMMFSGTQIIACHGPTQTTATADKTNPKCCPDGGCVCYVVRTGFNSSQGKMMQTIEYSQQQLTDDSKETGYALLVLLFFALIASGYVLKKGMEKGDRTTHELLIKCVIIITSTVPKQLPMQMAMAVNTALMGLMKCGVFCTEPYRVPIAGRVNVCVFDKTGTLTTDQLVPIGMMNPSGPRPGGPRKNGDTKTALKPGESVTVDGVVAKPELNGEKVQVVSNGDGSRVEVKCRDGKQVSLKRQNLLLATSGDDKEQLPPHGLYPMLEACPEALMVVAGCHALVEVEGAGVMGDPIELAALKGTEWRYESKSNKAMAGNWDATEKAIENLQAKMKTFNPQEKDKMEAAVKDMGLAKQRVSDAKAKALKSLVKSVTIKHRHHFSSKLQRMSTVAFVERDASPKGQVCLVKGSPEAIRSLMLSSEIPEWYDRTYREMAEHGLRVLALAYKWCDGTEPQLKAGGIPPRDWVESELRFGGFLAFGCKTRADSELVLRSIQDADIGLGMLTGDAPLTALHVAREVSICAPEVSRPCLLLELAQDGEAVQWVKAIGEERQPQPFCSPGVVELAKSNDLMVTEAALEAAAKHTDGKLWEEVAAIKVFARMSPHGKANVIRAMQKHNHATVFMCGDGGNDVGALKQADVGLALLSGYGNMNAGDEGSGEAVEDGKSAEDTLNSQQAQLTKRAKASQKLMQEEMKAVQAELQAKQKKRMMEEVQARCDRGEGGVMATVAAMKETMVDFKAELQARQKEIAAKHGNIYDKKKDDHVNLLKEEMESEMGSVVVRPGDASVAAPFTSRAPSVRNMVDVLRQGRCTQLSALQNQQIMMLECIISAYTISALSLEGGRSSDRQMMASSWLLSIAAMSFAFVTPIDKMSKTLPLSSLFHPAVFMSMLGQAVIHLGAMVIAVQMATEAMGPVKLREVVDFHKQQKMIRMGQLCKDGTVPPFLGNSTDNGCPAEPGFEEDMMAWALSMINTPFLPNLLNTVIWLVETSQMCAVTFVNYKGRPWMKGIMENHALFLSSFAMIAMVAVAAWELVPQANSLIHLAPFPDDAFRWKVMGLVFASLGGTFIWDRICIALFAPHIMTAMVESAKETTWKDVMDLLNTVGKVVGCLLVYLSGNPLIWMGAFWLYKKQKADAAAREAAAL